MTTGTTRDASTDAPERAKRETTPDAPTIGLRERKKQQTRELIVRVALERFDAQGFHATTIPEIARAADVSPRTVSSYFPAKEDLAFPHADEMFDRLEQRLDARAPEETTADALRAWITAEMPRWAADERLFRLQRRVLANHPELEPHGQRYMLRGERLIAAAVATDLACSADDLVARMASAATLAIFYVLDAHGRQTDAGSDASAPAPSSADAAEILDQALLFVNAGIRALQHARAER